MIGRRYDLFHVWGSTPELRCRGILFYPAEVVVAALKLSTSRIPLTLFVT